MIIIKVFNRLKHIITLSKLCLPKNQLLFFWVTNLYNCLLKTCSIDPAGVDREPRQIQEWKAKAPPGHFLIPGIETICKSKQNNPIYSTFVYIYCPFSIAIILFCKKQIDINFIPVFTVIDFLMYYSTNILNTPHFPPPESENNGLLLSLPVWPLYIMPSSTSKNWDSVFKGKS